ncbi:MAG: CDP-alcohol phosphatidyltransferase family protein [Candidatus Anstonellales archaeon]
MIGKMLRQKVTEALFFPVARFFTFLTPNQVTALTYPIVFIALYFIIANDFLLAFVFILLSSFIDNLDGAVAKLTKRQSAVGSFFDAFTDRMQELIILAGFAYIGYSFEAFLAISGSFLISYAKARAEMVKPLGNPDWPSIGERAERLLLVMAGTLTAAFYPQLWGYQTISLMLYALALTTFIGAFQRFLFALKILGRP